MSFSSFHERHIFVVAFIALWLCCFVVVGGGPHIRHGVLVMAAWMSLGHLTSPTSSMFSVLLPSFNQPTSNWPCL
jgi:hypothetical protein